MTGWSFRRGRRPRRWPVVAAAFTAVAGYLVLAAGPAGGPDARCHSPNSRAAGHSSSRVAGPGFGKRPACRMRRHFSMSTGTQVAGPDSARQHAGDRRHRPQRVVQRRPRPGYAQPGTYPITRLCEIPSGMVFVGRDSAPSPYPTATADDDHHAPPRRPRSRPRPRRPGAAGDHDDPAASRHDARPGRAARPRRRRARPRRPAPRTTTTTTTTLPKQTRALLLSALAIPPAGSETATGHGCNSNGLVLLTVDTKPVGKTTAGGRRLVLGAAAGQLAPGRALPGRRALRAVRHGLGLRRRPGDPAQLGHGDAADHRLLPPHRPGPVPATHQARCTHGSRGPGRRG